MFVGFSFFLNVGAIRGSHDLYLCCLCVLVFRFFLCASLGFSGCDSLHVWLVHRERAIAQFSTMPADAIAQFSMIHVRFCIIRISFFLNVVGSRSRKII